MMRRVIVDAAQREAFAQHRLAGEIEFCLRMHHSGPEIVSARAQSLDALGYHR